MLGRSQTAMVRYWPVVRLLLVIGGILTVLISLVRWGGTARPGPLFVVGVIVLTGLILTFGLIIAWIFSGPPPAARSLTADRADLRAVVAVLTAISSGCFVVGGIWDEVWHRRYGGFGDDFFWPPHLTIYISIGLFMLFAVLGLRMALRGAGSLRDRFRAESQLGLIGITSIFLMVSLPSDLIWHQIYGRDVTAWSLPHIVAACGGMFVTLGGASLGLSLLPRLEQWRGLGNLRLFEVLALLLIAMTTITTMQVGTTEWEGFKPLLNSGDVFKDALWQRPQWLYPVVVITIAIFFSNLALHLLRRIGVATAIIVFVIGFRFACLIVLGDNTSRFGLGYTSHLLMIAPALVLDGWYALNRHRADTLWTLTIGNVLACLAFLGVALPAIDLMLIYPPINGYTVPRMVGMGLIMALSAGWLGARFGGWLCSLDRSPVRLQPRPRALAVAFSGGSVAVLVIIVMLLTAQAPLSAS